MDLSIIIPVHNEESNVDPLYERLTNVLRDLGLCYEILIVDDGSTDSTAGRLDSIAERDSHLQIIHLTRNFGQTASLMAGIDRSRGALLVFLDGDNQNAPEDIPNLLEKIRAGYDVVSGWRRSRQDNLFTRTLPSMVANWLISTVTKVRLHDYGCTLKAYRREVVKNIRLYGEMHRFIPIYAAWQGAKVTEIEVAHYPRTAGGSHYGLSRIVSVILDLILIRFLDKYGQRPIHLYGSFGLLNLVLGLATFGLMLYYKFWGGKSFIETPLPTLTILFLAIGVMAFFFGINAEMLMRTYYESQEKKPYEIKRIVGRSE